MARVEKISDLLECYDFVKKHSPEHLYFNGETDIRKCLEFYSFMGCLYSLRDKSGLLHGVMIAWPMDDFEEGMPRINPQGENIFVMYAHAFKRYQGDGEMVKRFVLEAVRRFPKSKRLFYFRTQLAWDEKAAKYTRTGARKLHILRLHGATNAPKKPQAQEVPAEEVV